MIAIENEEVEWDDSEELEQVDSEDLVVSDEEMEDLKSIWEM